MGGRELDGQHLLLDRRQLGRHLLLRAAQHERAHAGPQPGEALRAAARRSSPAALPAPTPSVYPARRPSIGRTYSSRKRRTEGNSPGTVSARIACSSVSEFSSGVPVTAIVRRMRRSRTTWWVRAAAFFTACASSRSSARDRAVGREAAEGGRVEPEARVGGDDEVGAGDQVRDPRLCASASTTRRTTRSGREARGLRDPVGGDGGRASRRGSAGARSAGAVSRTCCASARHCSVFPSPMSSASTPPSSCRHRNASHSKPCCWYGRSAARSPAGAGTAAGGAVTASRSARHSTASSALVGEVLEVDPLRGARRAGSRSRTPTPGSRPTPRPASTRSRSRGCARDRKVPSTSFSRRFPAAIAVNSGPNGMSRPSTVTVTPRSNQSVRSVGATFTAIERLARDGRPAAARRRARRRRPAAAVSTGSDVGGEVERLLVGERARRGQAARAATSRAAAPPRPPAPRGGAAAPARAPTARSASPAVVAVRDRQHEQRRPRRGHRDGGVAAARPRSGPAGPAASARRSSSAASAGTTSGSPREQRGVDRRGERREHARARATSPVIQTPCSPMACARVDRDRLAVDEEPRARPGTRPPPGPRRAPGSRRRRAGRSRCPGATRGTPSASPCTSSSQTSGFGASSRNSQSGSCPAVAGTAARYSAPSSHAQRCCAGSRFSRFRTCGSDCQVSALRAQPGVRPRDGPHAEAQRPDRVGGRRRGWSARSSGARCAAAAPAPAPAAPAAWSPAAASAAGRRASSPSSASPPSSPALTGPRSHTPATVADRQKQCFRARRRGGGFPRCARGSSPSCVKKSGGVLLSHEVPLAVPSAQRVLASGFGM